MTPAEQILVDSSGRLGPRGVSLGRARRFSVEGGTR